MPPAEATAASIGKSVQIYGEVKGSEDLMVDGTIEGTITLSDSRLTIGPNAHVKANVSARDVVILGAVTGNILASGRVELRAGSNIKGDVRAGRLSIEENAVFSGKVDLTAAERTTSSHVTSAGAASASAPSGALFNATN
jgi:cytoskeletal protein CcmA (bactofilin family)